MLSAHDSVTQTALPSMEERKRIVSHRGSWTLNRVAGLRPLFLWIPTLVEDIPGYVANDGNRVFIRNDFFALDGREQCYILAREWLRVALRHCNRTKLIAKNSYSPVLAFFAQDLLLNFALEFWTHTTGALKAPTFAKGLDLNDIYTNLFNDLANHQQITSEEIYATLRTLPLKINLEEESPVTGTQRYTITFDYKRGVLPRTIDSTVFLDLKWFQVPASPNSLTDAEWKSLLTDSPFKRLTKEIDAIPAIAQPQCTPNIHNVEEILSSSGPAQLSLIKDDRRFLYDLIYVTVPKIKNIPDAQVVLNLFDNLVTRPSQYPIEEIYWLAIEELFGHVQKLKLITELIKTPQYKKLHERLKAIVSL